MISNNSKSDRGISGRLTPRVFLAAALVAALSSAALAQGRRFQQQQDPNQQNNNQNNQQGGNQQNGGNRQWGGGNGGGFNGGGNGGRGGGRFFRQGGGGYNDPFQNDYGILMDRNIFMRDRRIMVVQQQAPRIPPTPEQANIVIGIYMDEGDHHAWVENWSTGQKSPLHIGDSIANGKLTDIQPDKIEFETSAGKKIWISAGSNFTGSESSIDTAMINNVAAGGAGNLSMEQQLRARRLQEMTSGPMLVDPTALQQDQQGAPTEAVPAADGAPTPDQQPMQQQQMQPVAQPQPQPAPAAPSGNLSSLEEQMRARRAAALGQPQ